MEQHINNIIYILMWFLVPLIPAFLIFKYIPPEKVIVSGPFQGLKLNFSGSFAGYFILIILGTAVIPKLIKPVEAGYEVWTIEGEVLGKDGKRISNKLKPQVISVPPVEVVNGRFSMKVVGVRVAEDLIEFPNLYIRAQTYEDAPLEPLNYSKSKPSVIQKYYTVDWKNRVAKKVIKASLDLSPPVDTIMFANQVQPD